MQSASCDHITADIVDEAVETSATAGRQQAAAFMDGHGVPFAVIVRVLSADGRRRRVGRDQRPLPSSSSSSKRAPGTTRGSKS
jgi:hypothetical protein